MPRYSWRGVGGNACCRTTGRKRLCDSRCCFEGASVLAARREERAMQCNAQSQSRGYGAVDGPQLMRPAASPCGVVGRWINEWSVEGRVCGLEEETGDAGPSEPLKPNMTTAVPDCCSSLFGYTLVHSPPHHWYLRRHVDNTSERLLRAGRCCPRWFGGAYSSRACTLDGLYLVLLAGGVGSRRLALARACLAIPCRYQCTASSAIMAPICLHSC